MRRQYSQHKASAKQRGIPFLLSYTEWLAIWQASGHLSERGRGREKYCMARFGDRGPYAVGNVKIVQNAQNASEIMHPRDSRSLGAEIVALARDGLPHWES